MKRTACLLLGLCLVAPVLAEEAGDQSPEAMEILRKADAAIKAVSSVRYDAESKPTGVAARFGFLPVKGRAVMSGWANGNPERFFAHLVSTSPDSGESTEWTGGGDGDTFFIINHAEKKAYEDMDPNVLGSAGRVLQALSMPEFVHAAPFDDELGAPKVDYLGTETVGGVKCHKIGVDYGQAGRKSTWFFSTEDSLPRRRSIEFSSPQGDGSLDLVISNLEVDPAIDPAVYKLVLPDGYQQIDDFHP